MEREHLEPAVLAVELIREENRYRRRTGMMALAGFSCALVGGLAVFLATRYSSPSLVDTAKPVQVATNPPLKSEQVAQTLYTEPKSEPTPLTKDPQAKEPPSKTVPQPSTESSGTAPFNPLSGAIISRSDVPPDWKPGQEAPPTASQKPAEAAPAKQSGASLVTARMGGGDPESDATQISSILQGAGASVRSAQHYNLAGGVIGVQIVATCPAGSVEGLMSKLGGADRWSGSVEDRYGRVSGMISGRIRELRAKEQQLREKFEDDATEITVVREEIQKLNQGLAMARSARSPGIAVIVIGIGSL